MRYLSRVKKALIIGFSFLLIIIGIMLIIVEATSRNIWNGMVYHLAVIPLLSIAIGLLSTIVLKKYLVKPISKTAQICIIIWLILSLYFIFQSFISRQNMAEIEYFLIIILLIGAISGIVSLFFAKKINSKSSFVKMGLISCFSSILMGVAGSLYYNGRILQLPEKWNLNDLVHATKSFYTELISFTFVVTVGLYVSYMFIEIIHRLLLLVYKSKK